MFAESLRGSVSVSSSVKAELVSPEHHSSSSHSSASASADRMQQAFSELDIAKQIELALWTAHGFDPAHVAEGDGKPPSVLPDLDEICSSAKKRKRSAAEQAAIDERAQRVSAYRAQARSLLMSLRDPSNGSVRQRLSDGSLLPEDFVRMSAAGTRCVYCFEGVGRSDEPTHAVHVRLFWAHQIILLTLHGFVSYICTVW